jgi:sortase A
MSAALNGFVRKLGLFLMIGGAATIIWGVVVWQWQDPFTALYTLYEQHEMGSAYNQRAREYAIAPIPLPVVPHKGDRVVAAAERAARSAFISAEKREVFQEAARYESGSHDGQPIGRLIVPRLGLNMLVVNGTSESDLARGPGRDMQTFMPGENKLVYIAGHRTTFLAPFSHIDALRTGDSITLEMPYATFVYRVTRHIIVPASDLSVLQSGDHELLALQACHPRFFATHRYIVYARPVEIIPAVAHAVAFRPV